MDSPSARIAVYTCISGDYDVLSPPRLLEPGIDYICFTDQSDLAVSGWEIRPLECNLGNHAHENRFHKMCPHLVLPGYDISVYVDGNIEIMGGLRALVLRALATSDIGLYEHPFRNCVYQEALECLTIGHDWVWNIERQINIFQKRGYPEHNGLFECGVLIRRHSSERLREAMLAWWDCYRTGINRDQLYLPFVLWKLGIKFTPLGKSDFRFKRENFSLSGHRRNGASFLTRIRGRINRASSPLRF